MRYVIYGAGAIGGSLGGRLFEQGHDVVLIARGEHLAELQERGLRLRDPERSVTLDVPAVAGPGDIMFRGDEAVILTTKSQDSLDVLMTLAAVAPARVPVVCAQNGVENERLASRWFERVYAMTVRLPATHVSPGEVAQHSAPLGGVLDLGRYPGGVDEVAEGIARDLRGAGFRSDALARPMRPKFAKLLANLTNILDAAAGGEARRGELAQIIREEAVACFRAAGIEYSSGEEDAERARGLEVRAVPGQERVGSSTAQSLLRGGALETDYLNGEIVLLGRLHGVPTPVNEALQRLGRALVAEGRSPGSMSLTELRDRILG